MSPRVWYLFSLFFFFLGKLRSFTEEVNYACLILIESIADRIIESVGFIARIVATRTE